MGVAIGGEHFEDAVADFEDRDVECSAAQVEHCDLLFGFLFVQAVSQGGGGGFWDDALHIQSGNSSSVFSRLALRVVEVGGDGNHRFCDFFS